jgi:hypothetical protein
MTSCGGLCGPLSDERRDLGVIGWSEPLRLAQNYRIIFRQKLILMLFLPAMQQDWIGERLNVPQISEIKRYRLPRTSLQYIWNFFRGNDTKRKTSLAKRKENSSESNGIQFVLLHRPSSAGYRGVMTVEYG